jgi:hypothetical protein
MKRLAALAALLLLASSPSFAQVDRATVTGIVTDKDGAVVPGASVTVTNTATNVASTDLTNTAGSYLIVNLIPGPYRVDVELTGFKKHSVTTTLEVGQRARMDARLEIGSFSETVSVEARAQLVNTSDASLGKVVSQTQVANLPLAIRNWDDILALVPGVQQDRYSEQGGGTSFGRTGGMNVHGARALQNNFLLDGVDNNSVSTNVQELTTQVSRPSVDAIQEFKVVTSPYSAEYGRSPGAAVSVSTKSGTNVFHGTGYDYFRNEAMDSIDFFSKRAGSAKPANKQNQPGFNVGGPIVKDRAFFFADYEGTRINRGVTRVTRVPTLAERAGTFTTAVRDPLTGQPFADNQIPASRIDPRAAAILGLVPAPNQNGNNNFFRLGSLTDEVDRLLTRVDVRPSNADSLFGRYMWSDRARSIPGAFGGVIDGTGTSGFGNQKIRTNAFVGGWTRIVSSNMVNEARVSWSTATSDAVHQAFGLTPPPVAVIPGMITNPIVAGGFPGIEVDGYFGGSGLGRLGSPDFLPKFQRTEQFEYLDTLSWLRGGHALKFGVDIMAPMKNEYLDVPATRGTLSFRSTYTGNALADFLLGNATQIQLSNVYVVDQRHSAQMFFAQDDWKVGPRLTLNLGLRYDFITPALEAQNRQTNFNPAGGGSLVFAKDGSLEDRGLVKPDRNNFAPRVGVVYALDEKTVLRGGWGIFYNLFDRVGSEDQLAINLPGLINTVVVSTAAQPPVTTLAAGIPSSALLTSPSLNPTDGQLARIRIRAVSEDAPKTMLQQASAGLQRELPGEVILTADFVYTRGSNLATLINLNQPLPSAPGANDARGALPYPNFGFVEWRSQNGNSDYKGIDAGIEKRFTRGYSLGLAYTLSQSKDNSADHLAVSGSNSFPQNSRNFDSWYGPSDYDVRHRVVANFVVNLPLGQNVIARDWVLSGVFAARSGRPFTVNQTNNNVGTSMTGLPNMTGDPNGGPKTVDKWFNTGAFTPVTSGTFGNAPRNPVIGPGFKSFDISMQRHLRFGGYTATLRWDVFNVFNTVNFGTPNRNIAGGAAFGTITGLSGDPRTMQLAARFTF